MKQTVHDCVEHEDCTVVIGGEWPNAGSWISHAETDIDPAVRLNLEHPEAADRRPHGSTIKWRLATIEEASRLGLDNDAYKDLAAAAVVRIEDPAHPLQGTPTAVAKAAGLTLAEAHSRAKDKSLVRP